MAMSGILRRSITANVSQSVPLNITGSIIGVPLQSIHNKEQLKHGLSGNFKHTVHREYSKSTAEKR